MADHNVTAPKLSHNILWWLAYGAFCFWLQLRLPGIDAFVPAILVCLQERRWQLTVWLCLFCILIHEGTGTLAFGSTVLWYGALLLFFFAGRVLFVTNSLFFIILFSLIMGLVYAGIMIALPSLQYVSLSIGRLIEQSIAQALLIPPLWGLAQLTRKRFLAHETGI